MAADRRKAMAEQIAQSTVEKYGHRAGATGSSYQYKLDVTPTGILALDYALGIGGWPAGHPVEVFGPPDIGKSSTLGLNGIREAQKAGRLPGYIAVEPGFDPQWAAKHGVDLDMLAINWPDNGEEAFQMLWEWVRDGVPDFIVFDSIGAIMSEVEMQDDAKSRVGGQSKLITDGVKRIVQKAWKNDVTVIFLNQIRDDMKAKIPGMVKSPGGWAVEHHASIRVQLRPGKDRYTAKIDGDDVMIGRAIIAEIKRNKLSEGTGYKALFDFYQKSVEGEPFGIDRAQDVINVGMKTGVLRKNGSWYVHPTFPGQKHQVQGRPGIEKFLAANPEAIDKIRDDVLKVMYEKAQAPKEKPELKVVDGKKG